LTRVNLGCQVAGWQSGERGTERAGAVEATSPPRARCPAFEVLGVSILRARIAFSTDAA
jgi:hypothetical protein